MNIETAKVEASYFSKISNRVVYICIGDIGDFLLSTQEEVRTVTWYQNGCEKNKGYMPPVSKDDPKPKKKKSIEELIDSVGERAEKTQAKVRTPKEKKSSVLESKEFKTLKDAANSGETCKFTFEKKTWAVVTKGSWVLQKHIMEQIDGGLVLAIRGQGWYNYPKKMWTEFDSIFKSKSYTEGGNYSQSILPKKFEKYFNKF